MRSSLFFFIAGRIIWTAILMMGCSYLPELLRGFFGDIPIPDDGQWHSTGMVDEHWWWGTRHYIFFFMSVALTILSIIDSIIRIDDKSDGKLGRAF